MQELNSLIWNMLFSLSKTTLAFLSDSGLYCTYILCPHLQFQNSVVLPNSLRPLFLSLDSAPMHSEVSMGTNKGWFSCLAQIGWIREVHTSVFPSPADRKPLKGGGPVSCTAVAPAPGTHPEASWTLSRRLLNG